MNNIKFKNEIANKRNEHLLNDIQKNVFRIYQASKNSNHSRDLIYKERKRYEEYTGYQLGSIKKEFFSRIQMKQHEIFNIKNAFENQVDKNEEIFKLENLYNQRMENMLKDFSDNMSKLNDRNVKIAHEREEIIKNYINLENKTYEAIHKIMDENKKISENKSLGIQAHDFEKLVEKCINNINENKQGARDSSINSNKNFTIVINNKNLKPEAVLDVNNNAENINNILPNEKNIEVFNGKNLGNQNVENININQTNHHSNNIFDSAQSIRKNDLNSNSINGIKFCRFLLIKFLIYSFPDILYKNIAPEKTQILDNCQQSNSNRISKDSTNPQNEKGLKKKKKPIHPNEILNKILKSNSKQNLDKSISQSRSNTINSNNFETDKKGLLGELNKDNCNHISKNNKKQTNNIIIISEENQHYFTTNNVINTENQSTSKINILNNTEDYVKNRNISGITNEIINQKENQNNTITGNKGFEGKF